MTLQDAYETLGLSRTADASQVRAAYRARAASTHPDRGGETAEFIKVRAAYEIISTLLREPTLDDEAPIPPDLREVIDAIMADFVGQQKWAEVETARRLESLEQKMSAYIATASRADLRRFSATFRTSWDAVVAALFRECNDKCDSILQEYESWYTAETQAVFDDMYRRELWRFAWRRRFWEAFLVLGALAGGLTAVVGWTGNVRPWVSGALLALAFALSFLVHRWTARRERRVRERVEPLSVVPFSLQEGACFQTESRLRKGRLTTTALSAAGMLLGNAATAGLTVPIVGAVAGAAVGGAFDRLLNPTGRMRESMQQDLHRFMAVARPQMTAYVLEAHQQLLAEVQDRIVGNYRERVRGTVKLLTAGGRSNRRSAPGAAALNER